MPHITTMPALFLGHGNPMLAIEPNHFADSWRQLGQQLPRPRAILMISAHWYTRGTGITAMAQPRTIHDFGGFPQALFEVQYPAPGDPQLAQQVQQSLAPLPVALDQGWGLDHGCWALLKHMYPQADIPVLQLSIDATQPPAFHYQLGQQLAALRQQGVMLIGSGNVVHNLRRMDLARPESVFDWAERFSAEVRQALLAGNLSALVDFVSEEAPREEVRLAVPTPEHYLPLLYVLALQEKGKQATLFNDRAIAGSLTMTSVQVG